MDTTAAELVPTSLVIQAMRDSGYRDTAYAIAELIDNSIQAGASAVELVCVEDEFHLDQRKRRRLTKIAVGDTGHGMDEEALTRALQFGNGSRLHAKSGIGRFGMGLPSSSISQCRRLDVWSWVDGQQPIHSYIDLDLVANHEQTGVPQPTHAEIPKEWRQRLSHLGESGTLVVWSKIDKSLWKTARAVVQNSEFLIGRIYRKFLSGDEPRVTIRMATYQEGVQAPTSESPAQANDPLYLTARSATPSPYDVEPMFLQEGETHEVTVNFRGEEHVVKLTFSMARPEARQARAGKNPGATEYGRHAARNLGVSLVREERELAMDEAFVNTYQPTERWWGVEVDFPSSLDDLFGVTNNKQSARHFSEMASRYATLRGSSGDWAEYRRELERDEDPTAPLLEIIDTIDRRLRVIRDGLDAQTRGSRAARKRHDPNAAEATATSATRARQELGQSGASDEEEASRSEEEKRDALAEEFTEAGLAESDAHELAATTVDNGWKYSFAEAGLEGRNFFTVKPVAGEIVIKLNTKHPAYKNLVEVLGGDEDLEDLSKDTAVTRLERANKGLKLLLMAWARYEDEQPSDKLRSQVQDARAAWGAVAYDFLAE